MSGMHQRGNLIAQRLAAPGRHDHNRVSAIHHAINDGRLRTTE